MSGFKTSGFKLSDFEWLALKQAALLECLYTESMKLNELSGDAESHKKVDENYVWTRRSVVSQFSGGAEGTSRPEPSPSKLRPLFLSCFTRVKPPK